MQKRELATRSCTGVMYNRKKLEVGCSILWLTLAVNALFVPVQQGYCCCIHFQAYELYPICHVEGCMRHYRLDTFRDHHNVNKLKILVGFNASFAILKKGIKSRANVFKCGVKTEVRLQEELQQTCSICRENGNSLVFRMCLRHGLLSQGKKTLTNIYLLCGSSEVHKSTGSQCLP